MAEAILHFRKLSAAGFCARARELLNDFWFLRSAPDPEVLEPRKPQPCATGELLTIEKPVQLFGDFVAVHDDSEAVDL